MSGKEEKRVEDLKDVEAALASLVPRGDRLNRDRLMFLAGQASVARRGQDGAVRAARWAWPSAFAAMSAVAATLLVALLVRPGPGPGDRIAHVSAPVQPSAEKPAAADRTPASSLQPPASSLSVHAQGALLRFPSSRDSYHELLARVLDRGLDAWRPPAGNGATMTAAAPATYRELLETLLENS